MNKFFYRPLDKYKGFSYMNDPRGYISPYLNADLEGEVEHKVYMAKYMHLTNESNHIFKVRCNGQIYRGPV